MNSDVHEVEKNDDQRERMDLDPVGTPARSKHGIHDRWLGNGPYFVLNAMTNERRKFNLAVPGQFARSLPGIVRSQTLAWSPVETV